MQTLHLQRICKVDKEFPLKCNELSKNLTEWGYKEQEINESIQSTQTFFINELLKEQEKKKANRIPLILTYNQVLPNVKKVIANSWNLLQINKEFQNNFQ